MWTRRAEVADLCYLSPPITGLMQAPARLSLPVPEPFVGDTGTGGPPSTPQLSAEEETLEVGSLPEKFILLHAPSVSWPGGQQQRQHNRKPSAVASLPRPGTAQTALLGTPQPFAPLTGPPGRASGQDAVNGSRTGAGEQRPSLGGKMV
uniref:Uncharacterized protein n=1 Tax=Sphaerodactylus townsendi TaxID=933632 RepID=A0ACB8FCA3_9SAUR